VIKRMEVRRKGVQRSQTRNECENIRGVKKKVE
jgi:hypothetical protein